MTEPTYAIELRGFADSVLDPIDALMRGFGVSAARAETILGKLPTVVKRKADAREALKYARALNKLGAEIEIRAEATNKVVSVDELTGFERVISNVIESADPTARAGSVPRAAFRSGSHPAVTFPKTAAGVALTPSSLSLATTRPSEAAEDEADDAAKPNGDGSDPAPSRNGEERPLLLLERGLASSGSHASVGGLGIAAPEPPRLSAEPLELDETAIPAGRYGGSVPAMPDVLRQIRDFEATGWDPLRPDVGLGSTEKARPLTPSSLAGATARTPSDQPRAVSGPRARVSQPGLAREGAETPKTGAFGGGVALAILGGAAVVAGIYVAALTFGGVSGEVREALDGARQQYLESLEIQDVEGGSLGERASEDFEVTVRAGRCYGFIATTDEPMCDLDLHLFDGQTLLFEDTMLDNKPVVFHCPETDGQLRLNLSNAGLRGCSYGLARLEGQGSVGWPLEPYLRLYSDYLAGFPGARSLAAVGPIGHGTLGSGQVDELALAIPAGRCYNLLAVAQQGSDLDLRLLVDGRVVAEEASLASFSIVGYCAEAGDVTATVEVVMYSGQGAYAHQVFEGQPVVF